MAEDVEREEDSAESDARGGVPDWRMNEKVLDIAQQEAQNKRDDILLRRGDLQNRREITQQAIEAQARTGEQNREFLGKESTKTTLFGLAVLLSLMIFIIMLVRLDQAPLVNTLTSLFSGMVVGGFGGYGYALQKGSS